MSAVRHVFVDSDKVCLSVLGSVQVGKCSAFSEILLTDDNRYILAAEGRLQERSASRKAHIDMIDIEENNSCFGIDLARVFTKAWVFKPNLDDCCKAVPFNEKVLFGSLRAPKVFEGTFPKVSDERLNKKYFNRITVCDDLFLFFMRPGSVSRLFFKGENFTYVQDYAGIAEGSRRKRFAVTMKDFAQDEYKIYVEIKGVVYKLKRDIRIYSGSL